MERRKIRGGKRDLDIYDEDCGSQILIRKSLGKIFSEIKEKFPGIFKMEYYDTWEQETELTEPFNFHWIGMKLPKRKKWWPGPEYKIWLKVISGYFESSAVPDKKRYVRFHIEKEEIRDIVEKHLEEYFKKMGAEGREF